MFLGKEQYRGLVLKILKGGKDNFINSLVTKSVESKFNSSACPVCFKNTSKKIECWMITDSTGVALFKDRFDKESCATFAIAWVKHIYVGYEKYLAAQDDSDLSEDKLLRHLMRGDDDSFNKIIRLKLLNIHSLHDFIALRIC